MSNPLLSVSNLSVEFEGRRGTSLTAVDGVNFDVFPGETLGLVGQSGSGKSTIGRAILGLVPVAGGSITLDGAEITKASRRDRRELSKDLQVVFQDPYSSLNPSKRIGQTLAEPLIVHRSVSKEGIRAEIRSALSRVGLPPDTADRFPFDFSGGQLQRIAIARALMSSPRLVICDEPTSALDLSVQAQIMNLLVELQDTLQMSYLFITHDLAVVRFMSSRIVVLENGRVVESGDTEDVYRNPESAYTKALVQAVPVPDPDVQFGRSFAARLSAGSLGEELR